MMNNDNNGNFIINVNSSGNLIAQTINFNAPVNFDGKTDFSKQAQQQQTTQQQPDVQTLVTCVDSVREFFWRDSALAVIFCTCRDCYGYADNMSQFERDFHCQEGLLSSTFRNNPYMRLHIDKWAQNGAKQRALRLVEAYKDAVEQCVKA
jgi:hypothetical protein